METMVREIARPKNLFSMLGFSKARAAQAQARLVGARAVSFPCQVREFWLSAWGLPRSFP